MKRAIVALAIALTLMASVMLVPHQAQPAEAGYYGGSSGGSGSSLDCFYVFRIIYAGGKPFWAIPFLICVD